MAANAMKFRSVLGLHMSMDPVLLDACGDVLAAQFAGVTKVLTGAELWAGHLCGGRALLTLLSWVKGRCSMKFVPLNSFELWSTSVAILLKMFDRT